MLIGSSTDLLFIGSIQYKNYIGIRVFYFQIQNLNHSKGRPTCLGITDPVNICVKDQTIKNGHTKEETTSQCPYI